ncbi:hypothetical protein ERO13_D13G153650v2 [Gossypium hirsutum]|uniref:Uncharacterized protein n=3 Tax=Gossypium TaxID=3633 RepID=A0A5D2S526_GOSMU|nr:hypothetical protein ERO13_D13G153650v2 [Gossypium hirsutum]TYG38022.1 hypothetical protein ES288_D13G188500v1 [Gossypium darwinii]TYH35357.1 hypothetical protein ES332_D13G187900v1 [Gossypium tomentosum]TYI47528.1 hypothetical protein E1A91_D13G180000v1 [Gossypium mustelinum]
MCGIGSRDVGDGSSFGFVAAGIEEEIISWCGCFSEQERLSLLSVWGLCESKN